jgi:hypothetical protein
VGGVIEGVWLIKAQYIYRQNTKANPTEHWADTSTVEDRAAMQVI